MGTDGGNETTFSYSGGVGSVSYTMAEIAEAGTVMAGLGRRMDPAVDSLHAESVWLGNAVQLAPGPGAPSPGAALDSVAHALWVSGRARAGMAALSQQLVAAAENYAATEARTAAQTAAAGRMAAFRDGVGVWGWGALAPLKMAADLAGWLKRAKTNGLRTATEELLNNGVAYGAGALGPGTGMAYLLSQVRGAGTLIPAGVQPVQTVRKIADASGLSRPGQLAMRRVPAQEWNPETKQWPQGHAIPDAPEGDPWEVEASIAGMLSGTRDSYAYPPGSIGVVKVARADGTPAWIVHLPGTEDWSTFDSSNPFDMEGNLEGLTAGDMDSYLQQHVLVQELIKDALHASGALPTDDVLLTGHSGGGIHAGAAAADPEFLADVNVKMIVIAGAPARNMEVSNDIAVMDLGNEDDIVTALDFGPPPATANWVSVTSHRPSAAASGGLGDVVKEAHAVDNYLKDAVELDAGSNPAVMGQKEVLAGLLGVGVGAHVMGRKFVYQGRDVNDRIPGRTKTPKQGGKAQPSQPSASHPPASQPSAAGAVPSQGSGNH